MPIEFKLPDLGEGVKTADVVRVLVQKGDQIERDQTVLEVETEKAGLDVPSSVAGLVTEVMVKAGDTIPVGAVILSVEAEPTEQGAAPTSPAPPATAAPEPVAQVAEPGAAQAPTAIAEPSPPAEAPAQEVAPAPSPRDGSTPPQPAVPPAATAGEPVFAAPSVRSFAREIGVDIHQVEGSGPGGRISVEDVKRHARDQGPAQPGAPQPLEVPDFSRYGQVTREKMGNVRRAAAGHLSRSWATIPHVTVFDKADITDLEALRQRFKGKAEAAGGKLTITVMMMKLAASALRAFPAFNASLDPTTNEIVSKSYYHLGCAVDTPRGLVVPVIRDVDRKNMVQLAAELNEVAKRARDGKISPDQMQGGTFTITNLGGIGIGFFTPIVNHPEVAILGLGRAVMEPVWQDGQWVPRLMLPLSLSFDHRLVDGADGARFVRWIVDAIEQPLLLALEG